MNATVYQEDCLELALVNDLRELARVAAEIDDYCRGRGIDSRIAYSVNLAIDEVLTHIISDGYEDDEPHRIEIIVRKEGGTLVLAIVDDSSVTDVGETPNATVAADAESELAQALGDLGLFLVHQMMDSVNYRRMHGCNVVTMTKRFDAADSGD